MSYPDVRRGDGITNTKPGVVEAVKAAQTALGLKVADGKFGSGTEDIVRFFQKNSGLSVTGVVDQVTWAKLLPTAPATIPPVSGPNLKSFKFLDFTLDTKKLCEILVGNKAAADWFDLITSVLPSAIINTKLRVAAFLAQGSHESSAFTRLQENLNYSDPLRIAQIFRGDFDLDKDKVIDPEEIEFAKKFVKNPTGLANYAYRNQNGNGDEKSGDGYLFRGRGIFQLTGRENYAMFSTAVYKDDRAVKNPDMVAAPGAALQSACWYWNSRKLNVLADVSDIVAMTKKINGGLIGIEDRKKHYAHALEVLS